MPVVEVYGSAGIIKDVPAHVLPPEAWTDGANMRVVDGIMKRALGHSQIFGTPSVAPGFVFYVPAANENFWLYANLASVYVFDGLTHTDITRGAGPYTATNFRDWNGCLLGGVPILNNGSDVPQYWPTLSVATDLANLANWPVTLRAKVVRNFGRFLVALNLIDGGSSLPHALRWSHPADPGAVPSSWDVNDAEVDAGQTHLTDVQGGEILDAYLLFNYLVIYKQRSTHLMRFIGGVETMGFELMLNQGLLAPRCAAVIDSGLKHFCVSEDDVFVHSGSKNVEYPLHRKDRRYLFNDMDPTNYLNSFAFDNPIFEEVWFAYPSSGATFPNKALIWNYRTGEPTFRDFPGLSVDIGNIVAGGLGSYDTSSGSYDTDLGPYDQGGGRRLIAGDPTNTKLWALDQGFPFGVTSTTSFVQRLGWAIVGKDRAGQPKADYTSEKLFKRIWPKIKGVGAATVEIRLGSQEEFDGPVTWTPYKTFIPGQKFLDFEVVGRFGAIEVRNLADADWQIDGMDIEVEPVGVYAGVQ